MNNIRKRKICAVLVDRANYGRMKPVMQAITQHPNLQLQVLVAGTMPLERFGKPIEIVRSDNFVIDGQVLMELEGSLPITMAKSIGLGIIEFANEFQRLDPDIVLIIGDRYEGLSAAIAAACINKCIAHIQGGEVSGSIDESIRHAISKFAHFHFPSTKRSAEFLVRMGEHRQTILAIGCPSSDIARQLDRTFTPNVVNTEGSGVMIDITKPYMLVIYHPNTTKYGEERYEINEVLKALQEIQYQTILLWPNIDSGADHISKQIRIFRAHAKPGWLRLLTNLSPENFLKVLANAACAVGNSSSFVRDASYFGTPVVLVGDRQDGREHGEHVKFVQPKFEEIVSAIRYQLNNGKYQPSDLYGDGYVSQRIAAALANLTPYVQKRISYVMEYK